MNATGAAPRAPARPAGAAVRVLVFVPARRDWPGAGRGALGPGSVCAFVAIDAKGATHGGRLPLNRIPQARSVELVFDCLDVFSATVDVPRMGAAKLRLALPNLLEERMLVDAADCHFAWSAAQPGASGEAAGSTQRLSVAAIDRTTLVRALEACAQAQLQPLAAYSALYTVPAPRDGVLSLHMQDGQGTVRLGRDQGCSLALEPEAARAALALAAHQSNATTLRVYGAAAAESAGEPDSAAGQIAPAWAALVPLAQDIGLECAVAPVDIDGAALAESVNILQGAFAPAVGLNALGRWLVQRLREGSLRAPLGWLAVCAAIAVVGLNAYWLKLDAQYNDLRASMRHSFHDGFPEERTVVDELAQGRRAVAALRTHVGRASAEDFSIINAQALQLFAAAPVGIVESIEFEPGSYRVHFRAANAQDAGLRNALQAKAVGQGVSLRFDADGTAVLGADTGAARGGAR